MVGDGSGEHANSESWVVVNSGCGYDGVLYRWGDVYFTVRMHLVMWSYIFSRLKLFHICTHPHVTCRFFVISRHINNFLNLSSERS